MTSSSNVSPKEPDFTDKKYLQEAILHNIFLMLLIYQLTIKQDRMVFWTVGND